MTTTAPDRRRSDVPPDSAEDPPTGPPPAGGSGGSGGSGRTGGVGGDRPPHRPRHRVLVLVIVVLLIAVPFGYLVRSAMQSRESGVQKQRMAAAEGLTYQWPTKVQRRIYDVWIPYYSSRVAYYETNSWKTNRFYLQFRTSHRYLNQFLRDMGTSPSALREGRSGISEKRAETIGWDFHKAGHRYAGAVYHQADPQPDVAITVDETYKSRPRIHVVSTAHP